MISLISAIFAWVFLHGIFFLVSYITNATTFPQPLSESEEKKYIILFAQGSDTAKNILIERNLRLVAHIVKKFDNTGEETEDLISIGTVGLIKAISTFDQDKNTRLATYAARCIENEILMYLRANKKNRNEVLLYDPIGSDKEGNEIKLIDILGTENDIVDEIVEGSLEKEKLKERIKKLGRRERKVLELRYGLDDGTEKTQREIARMLGISRSYVSRIEKKVMQRLFKEMAVESVK